MYLIGLLRSMCSMSRGSLAQVRSKEYSTVDGFVAAKTPSPKSLNSGQGHRESWAGIYVGFPTTDFSGILGSWRILGKLLRRIAHPCADTPKWAVIFAQEAPRAP